MDLLDSATLQRLQNLGSPWQGLACSPVLIFSPDSRRLTYSGRSAHRDEPHGPYVLFGPQVLIVTWDLQTGGVVSAIKRERSCREKSGELCITYSRDGEMVSTLSRLDTGGVIISIFDVVSGVHTHDVHCPLLDGSRVYCIWTHGDSVRFATAEPKRIIVWEVGFALGATSTQVETLPGPDNLNEIGQFKFFPASYRAGFLYSTRILVWDTRNSQPMLRHRDIDPCLPITFSSDGRFLACSTVGSGIYLWKETPTGYILYGKLPPYGEPLLSPDGGSIIIFGGHMVRLWHTDSFTSGTSIQPPRQIGKFVLDFLPDKSLAVVARQRDDTTTVLDLKSGVPRLTIKAPMEVYGLRLIGETLVVLGEEKAITWTLPEGTFLPDARMNVEDSTQTIDFYNVDRGAVFDASISSDLQYVALAKQDIEDEAEYLEVYCTTTGRNLHVEVWVLALWFTPGGHDIWCAADIEANVFTVAEGALDHTRSVVNIEDGSLGCPWGSSRGYRVTSDGWTLGPNGKRLLMLPPPWQSGASRRAWSGQFLALLHAALPEPVIIEFEL